MSLLTRLPEAGTPRWPGRLLVALTCLVGFCAFYRPLWDGDTFWQLAEGREAWHRLAFIRTEIFSFTAPGAHWDNFEWLFQILGYRFWSLGGDALVVVVTATSGAIALFLAWRVARRLGVDAASFSLLAALGLPLLSERVRFRPELFTLILLPALFLLILDVPPERSAIRKRALGVGLVFLIWVQGHGGWAFGLLLMATWFGGEILDQGLKGQLKPYTVVPPFVLASAGVLSLFFNPFGWRAVWVPFQHMIRFSDKSLVAIEEWQRMPWSGLYLWFGICCLALLGYLFLSKRSNWAERLTVASQVALSFLWVRYPACGVLVILPVAARHLGLWTERRPLSALVKAASLFVLTSSLIFNVPGMASRRDLSLVYPVQEAVFLRENGITGRVLAPFTVCGYLEWANYPLQKIPFDGRHFLFESVLVQYRDAHRSLENYESFLHAWPITMAILANPTQDNFLKGPDGRPLPRGTSHYLYPSKEWALVYFGNYGMVFLKRIPPNEAWIRSFEYQFLRLDDPGLITEARTSEPFRLGLAAEIGRRLDDPALFVFHEKLLDLKKQVAGASL